MIWCHRSQIQSFPLNPLSVCFKLYSYFRYYISTWPFAMCNFLDKKCAVPSVMSNFILVYPKKKALKNQIFLDDQNKTFKSFSLFKNKKMSRSNLTNLNILAINILWWAKKSQKYFENATLIKIIRYLWKNNVPNFVGWKNTLVLVDKDPSELFFLHFSTDFVLGLCPQIHSLQSLRLPWFDWCINTQRRLY